MNPYKMKQSEVVSAVIGDGAATIVECSNQSDTMPIPVLTIVLPSGTEIRNEGHDDAIVVNYPARSIQLDSTGTRQLYAFLKAYYEGKP